MNLADLLTQTFFVGLVAAAIRMAAPLLLAALGDVFCQRSGILNLGIEGIMLAGALAAFLVSYYSGSPWLGVLFAMFISLLLALIHGWLSITVGADQVVSGIGVLILSVGIAALVHRVAFGIYTLPPKAAPIPTLSILGLDQRPILGPIFFQHHALVYIAFALVPLAWILLFRTTFGLRIIAVGENPNAGETAGINVHRVRYLCVLIGGVMAGLAGATLSLGSLNLFKDDMIAGRGFIAIACVIFGRWNPVGAMGAALFFGLAEALQIRLQVAQLQLVPPQLLTGLPYIATLLVVLGGISKARPPRALCIPFLGRNARS